MRKTNAAAFFALSLIALAGLVSLATAQSSSQISLSPTKGPPDSTIQVTLIGWEMDPSLSVVICSQQGNGEYGVSTLVPVWNDAEHSPYPWVKTGPNTWTRSYYVALGPMSSGENVITVRTGPYATDYICETTFTLVTGSASGNGSSAGTNGNGTNLTGLAALGIGGAVCAGGAVVGARRFSRKRKGRIIEKKRVLGEDTGTSYEKPPEVFVQEWTPPDKPPEKPIKEETLVEWALLPDYVKQAWRQYEACRRDATNLNSQIKALNMQYDRSKKIHIINVFKASVKLGFQTAGILEDGVQVVYLDKLRIAREGARLTNDFKRASLAESAIADIEKYQQSVAEARIAYKEATQAAAGLKDAINVWNLRMQDLHKPGWDFRGISYDAIRMMDSLKADPSMSRFLSGKNNPLSLLNGENAMNPEDALTFALKSALKNALAEMNQWSETLRNSQSVLQPTLSEADKVLELCSGAVDNISGKINKVIGKAPDLGGLDMDDPAILAEGQAGLERLNNRIGWLQMHFQMAVACMSENKSVIEGYDPAHVPQDNLAKENNSNVVEQE